LTEQNPVRLLRRTKAVIFWRLSAEENLSKR